MGNCPSVCLGVLRGPRLLRVAEREGPRDLARLTKTSWGYRRRNLGLVGSTKQQQQLVQQQQQLIQQQQQQQFMPPQASQSAWSDTKRADEEQGIGMLLLGLAAAAAEREVTGALEPTNMVHNPVLPRIPGMDQHLRQWPRAVPVAGKTW